MAIDVYVYDNLMAPLASAFIEALETDHVSVVVDVQPSRARGSLYGATLQPPSPAEPVIVWLDDTSGTWAPTSLAHLNPSTNPRLDVILYPVPTAPPGPTPVSPVGPQGTGAFITEQVNNGTWQPDEAAGVLSLLRTSITASRFEVMPPKFSERVQRWKEMLVALGLEVPTERKGVAITVG